MITSSQALGVLVEAALLSLLFTSIYWLQNALNIDHKQRVRFLRLGIIATWGVTLLSIVILSLNTRHSIGQLLPTTEPLRKIVDNSTARVWIFEGYNSFVVHLILSGYLIGLAITIGRIISSYLKMRKLLLNSSSESVAGLEFRSTQFTEAPFSFGFLNPQIFLPRRLLLDQSPDTLRVMLIHEKTHVKNRDPRWKIISLLTRAILFFTPTSWYLHRKLELETEIECDRLTIKESGVGLQKYGSLLIDALADIQDRKQNPIFTYMSDNNLRRRIEAMKAKTLQRPLLSIVFSSLIIAASATAIAATAGVSKFKGQYMIKADILMAEKVIASPQIIAFQNEPASIEMVSEHPEEILQMTLTASEYSNINVTRGIDLKMVIDYKTKNQSIRANTRIVVVPGKEGIVTIGANPNSAMKVKITAERQ